MPVVRRASDGTTSNFKTRRVKAHGYAQLGKNQRDSRIWSSYYAVSATISVSLQRELSLFNADVAGTGAYSVSNRRGRARHPNNTNEHRNGGTHAD